MPHPPRPPRPLPAVPDLEQQRKQAKELLRAARARDPGALRRLREHHPRLAPLPDDDWPPERLSLHDAQLVLAREHGFASWPRLKAHVEAAVAARVTHPFVHELSYYEERARGLLAVLPDGAPATLDQVRSWHPSYADADDGTILAAARGGAFTLEDARLVYAREHGSRSWRALAARLRRLRAGTAREPFMQVVERARARDWPAAEALLRDHPELVRARGTNGNTLLNLASGMVACPAPGEAENGSEPGPPERLAPLRRLLAAGADPDRANDRGWTPLHQAAYRDDAEMVALLLAAGARVDGEAHGSGGTPLAAALFWGHRAAAAPLAAVAVLPANLRIAAGLGRLDLLDACFGRGGRLRPAAFRGRGFYRPHSGFPAWRPSDDPQEVLDEALVWAAKSGRVAAMEALAARGARVDADPYRGTPLIWAAQRGRVEAIDWLLDHGAEVGRVATFGGPDILGVTALHVAASAGRLAAVERLLERGADPGVEDGAYHSTPAGWARHFGKEEVALRLEAAAKPT